MKNLSIAGSFLLSVKYGAGEASIDAKIGRSTR